MQPKAFKLAVCIPTHNGRALYLCELLDSILRQKNLLESGRIQICISDNASQDGTSELVEQYQRNSTIPIKYFRFSMDMGGVKNFLNVVNMSDSEYCWLVGSDDIILDNGIERVMQDLRENPLIPAMTVNKLNFNKSLEYFIGTDHDIVLPFNSIQTQILVSFENIISNLYMSFNYISAHIFRYDDWKSVVEIYDLDYLLKLRHFPHTFIFSQIAKKHQKWLWIADYCVIQRLENFCVMEKVGQRNSVYATQLTEDILKGLSLVLNNSSPAYFNLIRKLFLLYWNPWFIMKYKVEKNFCRREEIIMTKRCKKWFRYVSLFWVTSYPILLMPSSIVRPIKCAFDYAYSFIISYKFFKPVRNIGKKFFYTILRLIGIENNRENNYGNARIIASQYLLNTSRSNK